MTIDFSSPYPAHLPIRRTSAWSNFFTGIPLRRRPAMHTVANAPKKARRDTPLDGWIFMTKPHTPVCRRMGTPTPA